MNRATRINVSTMGVILAIAGMVHGIFEIFQGNTPTGGLIIQTIGDAHQMWLYGTEEAFTIVPNFLITGILAMVVSLTVVIWSGWFIARKRGAVVFLLLSVLQFLVGGGFAQIFQVLLVAAAATRDSYPPDLVSSPFSCDPPAFSGSTVAMAAAAFCLCPIRRDGRRHLWLFSPAEQPVRPGCRYVTQFSHHAGVYHPRSASANDPCWSSQ